MNQYPELENLRKIAKILDDLKIPYYVTGGFAVSVYGQPRFTADIDIVIKMQKINSSEFAEKIREIFPLGYVDEEMIKNAIARASEFNVIDPESGLKIDFFITKWDEFEKECFQSIQTKDYDYKIKFISPENLILSKLIWYKDSQSTRQLEDIVSVMEIQKKLDHKYLDNWINKLQLSEEWQAARNLLRRQQ